MNYPNEEDLIKSNNQISQKISTKYIKSMNYPQNNINKGKIILKKQKIKENIVNPEIIEFKLKGDFYLNMPRPIQNLEPYQKKEKIKKNQIFEEIETNSEYPMPKHSIKSSNSFKINTKINNKKYMNKNKINELDNNDMLYKNYSNNNISKNNFNILGQNSGKINQKKIANFNINNPTNNNSDLKMTTSSIQISGTNFPKKNSYSKSNNNNYDHILYPISLKSDKNINININKTKAKREYNKIKSDNLIQELKTNKININKNEDSMDLDTYNENNFMQIDNEYNNIFFYNSKNKINNYTNDKSENLANYKINNNNKKMSLAKENAKSKFIYKKIKNLNNKKEEPKKQGNIIIKEKRIKNNLKNNFNIIDFNINLPFKEEKISININNDTDSIIKEKIEEIINNNELNNNYLEPIFSLVNNSINVLRNVNNLKITKIKKFNRINFEDLNEDLNFSFILDLYEKNKYNEFFEDFDEINENEKFLNLTI